MPKIKGKERRFKILNECLRDPHKKYEYTTLLAELNRQLAMVDVNLQVSERTLKDDIDDMIYEYGIELDAKLKKQRPVVLRYANLSDTINKLSMDEANALRKTIDLLVQFEEPRPIQYEYMRVCLQQILKDQSLDVDNPAVMFADNLDQKGRDYFVELCGYIFEKQSLKIEYRPYNSENRTYQVSPYLLKQYNERWFLMAKDIESDMLLTLALDRIECIKKSSIRYVPCQEDWNDYFEEFVGVTLFKDRKIEPVRLKIKTGRFPYIETKPIHSTQRVIKDLCTEDSIVVEIRVRPNNELYSQILSYGESLEVLEPSWLRDKIREKVTALADLYKK